MFPRSQRSFCAILTLQVEVVTDNDPSYPPLLQVWKLRQDQNSNSCIIKKLGIELGGEFVLRHPYPRWVPGSHGHLLLSFDIPKAGFVGCSDFHEGRESGSSYINTMACSPKTFSIENKKDASLCTAWIIQTKRPEFGFRCHFKGITDEVEHSHRDVSRMVRPNK